MEFNLSLSDSDKKLLLDGGVSQGNIDKLEAEEFTMVGLRAMTARDLKDAIDCKLGAASTIVGIANSAQPAATMNAPVSTPQAVAVTVNQAVDVDKMPLDQALTLLVSDTGNQEAFARVETLTSDGSKRPRKCFILDGSTVNIGLTTACNADLTQKKLLEQPGGRFRQTYQTHYFKDAFRVRIWASPLDGSPMQHWKDKETGEHYVDGDNLDWTPLFKIDRAKWLSFARLPEAKQLYGSLVPKNIDPKNIISELSQSDPDPRWNKLVDAVEDAKKSHPHLLSTAEAALEYTDPAPRSETLSYNPRNLDQAPPVTRSGSFPNPNY